MGRALTALAVLALLGAAFFWAVTRPPGLEAGFLGGLEGDAARGAQVMAAAGCASCHAAPASEDKRLLAGGTAFASDFGTFYAPNISPSAAGIGGWSEAQFARAVVKGVSPAGQHYYPAFPYTAYAGMTAQDVADLYAHLQTLPPSDQTSRPHEVGFPFSFRRGLGLWRLAFARQGPVLAEPANKEIARGRYLVEVLGHCGECHTPRNAFGGLRRGDWLAGAPNPSGKGRIPNITPGGLEWSEADIASYLETGFTPDYDSAGGSMVAVIEELATLPQSDRAAIAAYLKAVPARE